MDSSKNVNLISLDWLQRNKQPLEWPDAAITLTVSIPCHIAGTHAKCAMRLVRVLGEG